MTAPCPLLVTARLCSPLAGDPPALDSLLIKGLMRALPSIQRQFGLRDAGPLRTEMDRKVPLPRGPEPEAEYVGRFLAAFPLADDAGLLRTNATALFDWFAQGWRASPLKYTVLAGWPVAHCSAPILPRCVESVEHIAKRVGVENAGLLAEDERRVVSTTNSWTKSYRLPLRVRPVPAVCWFAVGDRRGLVKLLKGVHSIGKKMSDGYGRVSRWEAEPVGEDLSWHAPHERGSVLMRALPAGPHLPRDLVGFRPDFAAVRDPYWHPDVHCEAVTPC